MASVPLTITNGTSPYIISVKKTGDSVERFVSYNAGNLVFNAVQDGTTVSYTVTLLDSNGCAASATTSFSCPLVVTCDTPYDIILLIDESGSISGANFTIMKNGVKLILDQLKQYLDSGIIQIGLQAFGSGGTACTRTLQTLSTNYTTLTNAVNTFSQAGNNTPIAAGLREAYTLVTGVNSRNNDKKIILITDGIPNISEACVFITEAEGRTITTTRANTIKASIYNSIYRTEIITVGITSGADNTFLANNVASSPANHFTANTFTDFANISEDIANKICE